ncbi:rhodanese-like domain-containing protein [Pseudofulvibacter geojedonensis]|uniref:Rhodanese-like domain-containing protein n=1 Tax=Pseudofulvibacter geojedonensis TaxID=1123758 RepID=A0ABW3I1K9_9FLAO
MKKLFILFLLASTISWSQNSSFDEMVANTFKPSIPFISTDELNNHYQQYIILDTREKIEYNVSHLPDAIYIGDKEFNLRKTLKLLSKDKPIVVYCSIGARSDFIGKKLARKDLKVYNLYGGIFKWVNEEKDVIDNEGNLIKKVHPYNEEWAVWIKTKNTSLK